MPMPQECPFKKMVSLKSHTNAKSQTDLFLCFSGFQKGSGELFFSFLEKNVFGLASQIRSFTKPLKGRARARLRPTPRGCQRCRLPGFRSFCLGRGFFFKWGHIIFYDVLPGFCLKVFF